MIKKFTITITHKSGTLVKFSEKEIQGYKVMPEGFFFIQTKDVETERKNKSGDVDKLNVTFAGHYYPIADILRIDIENDTEFPDELDVAKFYKFKEHGINMVHQDINGEGMTPFLKAKKDVERDKKIQILTAKKRRKENMN